MWLNPFSANEKLLNWDLKSRKKRDINWKGLFDFRKSITIKEILINALSNKLIIFSSSRT